ncbi:MAG: non-canonical purine NTP pyrophosphatase, partial [Kiritimatiellia bacterium]
MKLLVATSNGDKLREIRQILIFPWLEIVGLDEFSSPQRVGEDGETFEANAIKKARTFALATGNWTMADDSGLEVHALKGAPGVRSARYAGELGDYEANNRKLLEELKGIENRRATFRCVLALSDPQGRVWTVEGVCHGVIT